ncbi:hypothetical protein BC937DRAFT_86696 [Endogone sp. FLAS-F59071]|nr:hypothetical protein BC937DRAFT_86696 [Endogone sp. FLAS-F59071]|eukprot:RUS19925.1 hypothetical protein BC937DRAFT_86696 [Endogone sp. FLAS-F59071]
MAPSYDKSAYVKRIESANIDMNDYPAGQQVTYKYYVGRYHLFQHQLRKVVSEDYLDVSCYTLYYCIFFHDYPLLIMMASHVDCQLLQSRIQAEADLEFAFRRCTKYHYENKRHIFIHLLTVKLILGYIPTPALLARYGLTVPFADLIKAMLSGNVAQYTAVLDAHMEWFLRTSNYMLLRERGKVVVWRNLFKKVYNITRNPTRNGPPQIRIDHCLIALRLSTLDSYDYMDAESLLVSLLDQGYLKGYIQHYLHIVVLSKQNPFPPVATVQITTEVYDESLNQRDRDE